jgi:hypothetical protein
MTDSDSPVATPVNRFSASPNVNPSRLPVSAASSLSPSVVAAPLSSSRGGVASQVGQSVSATVVVRPANDHYSVRGGRGVPVPEEDDQATNRVDTPRTYMVAHPPTGNSGSRSFLVQAAGVCNGASVTCDVDYRWGPAYPAGGRWYSLYHCCGSKAYASTPAGHSRHPVSPDCPIIKVLFFHSFVF